MLTTNRVFGNLFGDKAISTMRLYFFGKMVQANLIKNNTNGKYDTHIQALALALAAMESEIAALDAAMNGQVISTREVDELMNTFASYMSAEEPFIKRALGGESSAGYRSMYPNKISEYTSITKTTLPVLSLRVQQAAIKYAVGLGPTLSAALQAFATDYKQAFENQKTQMSTVKKDRSNRSTLEFNLQTALTITVYSIAAMYPNDVDKCGELFPFSMLYTQTKRRQYILTGSLEQGEVKLLLNRTLKKRNQITVRNTGTNAPVRIWLAASPNDAAPANALEIQPENTKNIKLSELGDLKNTCLMIQDTSMLNTATYEIVFKGFKEIIENTIAVTEEMKLVRA